MDLLVTVDLVERYRDVDPDKLTNARSFAVNNDRLACIAVAHRLHKALRYCSSALWDGISTFVRSFEDALQDSLTRGTLGTPGVNEANR